MTIALEGSVEAEEAKTTKGPEVVADRMCDGGLASPSAAKEEANGRTLGVIDPFDEVVQRLLAGASETSSPRVEPCLPDMCESRQFDGRTLDYE